MKILSLECSAKSASAAVSDNEKILDEQFTNAGLTHSQTLMPMAQAVLLNTKTDVKNIDVFAVTAGPGSFTGVRIGIAALKGLADAQKKPCFALSATEVIAYPFKDFDGVVCAVMDARCNQVYTACFENGKRLTEDEAILISELKENLQKLNKKIIFAGDGALMCFNTLANEIENISIADEEQRYPKASSVCSLAYEKICNGEKTVSAKELLPVYLRLPQAQRELNNKKANIKGE